MREVSALVEIPKHENVIFCYDYWLEKNQTGEIVPAASRLKRLFSSIFNSDCKNSTLYLQMELCQSSMEKFIHERNKLFYRSLYGVHDKKDMFSRVCPRLEGYFNISNFALNKSIIFDIFTQVLKGLNHIHKHGWIHCDIKPGNILITWRRNVFERSYEPSVKIADFGLSVPTDKNNKRTKSYGATALVRKCKTI